MQDSHAIPSYPAQRLAVQDWAHENSQTYIPKKVTNTCAAIVTEKNTFLVTAFLGSGTYKKISSMTDSFGKEYIRATVPPKGRCKHRKEFISVVKKEVNFMERLQELLRDDERKFFVSPYTLSIDVMTTKKKPKLVLLHEKYDGDGRDVQAILQVIKFLHDSAIGLSILHRLGYVHCDYKPANVLFLGNPKSKSRLIQAKLHDFGGAVKIGKKVGAHTKFYSPPECFVKGCRAAPSMDAYALGVSILHMLFKQRLFDENILLTDQNFAQLDPQEVFTKMTDLVPKYHVVTKELVRIAEELMHPTPSMRLSCRNAAHRLAHCLNVMTPSPCTIL
jgi:serine/threonine protein kinase